MQRANLILVGIVAVCWLSGCATKTYGRQGAVTPFEQDVMTCREIDLEMAKVRGFEDRVNQESEFSGRDVLAILGDFGIGNALEKSAALESARRRLDELRTLHAAKQCGASPA
jgi:hypothetical protein